MNLALDSLRVTAYEISDKESERLSRPRYEHVHLLDRYHSSFAEACGGIGCGLCTTLGNLKPTKLLVRLSTILSVTFV